MHPALYKGSRKSKGLPRGGLFTLYQLLDGSGQSIADSSVSASRPAIVGATSGAEASDPVWTTKGLTFDGVDDFALMPTITLGAENTIIFVGAVTTILATVAIYGSSLSTTSMGVRATTGALLNTLNDSIGQKTIDQGAVTVNVPFMATRRVSQAGQFMDSHLNAVKSTAVATVGAHAANTNSALFIGKSGAGEFWPGPVYYAALYSRVLTDAEVQTAYRAIRASMAVRGVVLP